MRYYFAQINLNIDTYAHSYAITIPLSIILYHDKYTWIPFSHFLTTFIPKKGEKN